MLIIASKKLSANEAILVASCEEREGKLSDKHSIRFAKKSANLSLNIIIAENLFLTACFV